MAVVDDVPDFLNNDTDTRSLRSILSQQYAYAAAGEEGEDEEEEETEDRFKKGSVHKEKCTNGFRPKIQPLNVRKMAKLKFHCHHNDRKRKSEMRRRKLVEKLRKDYQICVTDMSESTANEIIRKMEMMEKERREREKKAAQQTFNAVKKLWEEQKYKRRGTKTTYSTQVRKDRTIVPCTEPAETQSDKKDSAAAAAAAAEEPSDEDEEVEVTEEPEPDTKAKPEIYRVNRKDGECRQVQDRPPAEREITGDVGKSFPASDIADDFENNLEYLGEDEYLPCPEVHVRQPKPVPYEEYLECSPKRVVFQDYKKGQVYLQVIRITNVGFETIHCRYLGIAVRVRQEERFPIGVAVRDSVKLRPGLSCSTKIRLCSQSDEKQLECSIVYETRRQTQPQQHSFFFVPVVCAPARAVVKVTPLKVRFPVLTWCAATGSEGAKLLKKYIKIENTGGKGCHCQIVRGGQDEGSTVYGGEDDVGGEDEGETEENTTPVLPVKETANKSNSSLVTGTSTTTSSRYLGHEGEDQGRRHVEPPAWMDDLTSELIENVFATFRFAEKYSIEVPARSTTYVEVRFIPEYRGFHQETYLIRFEDCYNCEEEVIELTGDIKKLPLVAEPQVIDMKICTANSGVYSSTFRVFNTSRGPFAISVKIPSSMKRHAHVQPRTTIIQSSSHAEFSVRLYPRYWVLYLESSTLVSHIDCGLSRIASSIQFGSQPGRLDEVSITYEYEGDQHTNLEEISH